jgi:SNF family Na+-dependent transporter
MSKPKESWNSRIGVILAVAGSAVGAGNFLRFPGQVAEYGGGAFMIAYFVAFLLLGLPMCWTEWTLGRYAGRKFGFNAIPGIYSAILKHPIAKYLGSLCVLIPTLIFTYLVCIQGWCLGYAVNFITGNIHFATPGEAQSFFATFTGIASDGAALGFGLDKVGGYIIIAFVLNFILVYRGIAKGIELFCRYAMPTLLVIAFIILVRVLTLGTPNPDTPEANISNGLGFMWNPQKVFLEHKATSETAEVRWVRDQELVGKQSFEAAQAKVQASPENLRIKDVPVIEQLKRPKLWLSAAGQLFFSLTVGFGVIATYASYLSKKDDIVLSSLAATSANEFTEVALGGLITLPAAVAFLGIENIQGNTSLFSLGFNALPMVFSNMPGGTIFGFLFFFLLFLATVSGCISTLQPGIAFLEEATQINRKQSVAILGLLTALGASFVMYFSKDITALDSLDFWVGTFLVFVTATIFIILFGWVLGIDKAFNEAHLGSALRLPAFFKIIIKYVCPLFLLTIFAFWVVLDVIGFDSGTVDHHITDLIGNASTGTPRNTTAVLAVGLVLLVWAFYSLLSSGVKRYHDICKK